jgi:hypothetical protein
MRWMICSTAERTVGQSTVGQGGQAKMAKKQRFQFLIELERPTGVDAEDLRQIIEDTFRSIREVDDPLYHLNRDSVRVRRVKVPDAL